MVVSNLEGPWFQNTVLLTLLFLSPSNATGMEALGWEEKEKKKKANRNKRLGQTDSSL